MSKILPAILNSFSDLATAIKECLTDNHDYDDVVLKTPPNYKNPKKCIKICNGLVCRCIFCPGEGCP